MERSFCVQLVVGPFEGINDSFATHLEREGGENLRLPLLGMRAIRHHYDQWIEDNPEGSFEKMCKDSKAIVAAVSRTIVGFDPVVRHLHSSIVPTVIMSNFPTAPVDILCFMDRWPGMKIVGVHFVFDYHSGQSELWRKNHETLCEHLKSGFYGQVKTHWIHSAPKQEEAEKIVSLQEENAAAELAVA